MKSLSSRERLLVFVVAPAVILIVAGYYIFLYEPPAAHSHHGHSHHGHSHSHSDHE